MIINGCKRCPKCEKTLPVIQFHKSNQRGDGYAYRCRKCHSIQGMKWQSNNKDRKNAYMKQWVNENKDRLYARRKELYLANRDKMLSKMRGAYRRLKDQIFNAYGHKCSCCGEEKKEFLCVDHVNGGGCKDRKRNPQGVYVRIRQQGFPKDKYQLLCHNCNMSIGFYGYCPHKPEIKRPLFCEKKSK